MLVTSISKSIRLVLVRRFRKFSIVLCGLIFGCVGTVAFAAGMTNQEVVEMVKAGLPESTIVLAVQRDTSGFKTSAQDLIQLKKQGVSQKVLDAMLGGGDASVASAPAAYAPAPAPAPALGGMQPGMYQMAPPVFAVDGNRRVQLRQAQQKMKLSGFGGMVPFVDAKTKVSFAGTKSEIRVSSGAVVFEAPLRMDAHTSEQAYVIHMNVSRNSRDSVDSSVSMMGNMKTGPTSKDLVPTTIAQIKGSASQFGSPHRISPNSPLAPGEYAINVQGMYYDFGVD